MFFNARKNGYDAGDGPVRYLDGSSLTRPLEAPRPQMLAMAAFVLAAAVIGGVFLFNVIDNVTHSAERARATVEQNLARPASMASLPNLASLVGLNAEGVKAAVTVEEAGIYGGLGSAVCEALSCGPARSRIPVCVMGIRDTYGTSANDYEQLLEAYHLGIDDIAKQVKEAIRLA